MLDPVLLRENLGYASGIHKAIAHQAPISNLLVLKKEEQFTVTQIHTRPQFTQSVTSDHFINLKLKRRTQLFTEWQKYVLRTEASTLGANNRGCK